MISRLKLPALALVLCCTAACKSTPKPPPPSPEEAMKQMMKLATPGPEHAALMRQAGTWEEHYKMRWAPDAPWQETTGTSVSHAILGGRYLMEEVSFTMEGQPMQGIQILGYDNMTGEYTAQWADTMSTWWMISRGKMNAEGVLHMTGTMTDIAGTRPFHMVVTRHGETACHVDMYDTIPDKGEVLVMTIDSKKR
jgi:hypothetical protein